MSKTLLILMAAATVALAAEEPPFKYDAQKHRAIQHGGIWYLTDKPKEAAKETKAEDSGTWINRVSLAPVGALKTDDIDGKSQWGAGFQIGYDVNPFVGIHVRALSFEGEGESTHERKTDKGFGSVTTGEDDWGGRLVDELSILVPTKISRFSNESLSLFVTPSGNYDLNTDDYGVGVGLGLGWRLSKTLSVSGDYSVRAWFHKPTHVDSLLSGQINLRF